MNKIDYPITPAIRFLRGHQIAFVPHLYPYLDHGGTQHAANCLQVPEYTVIKTLVLQTDLRKPLLMLMHGDKEVSTKQLARIIEAKTVTPCDIAGVQKHTGYQVGGVSPFGTRAQLPVYIEETILTLEQIYINGGKRGFLVEIDPQVMPQTLSTQVVMVGIEVSS